MSIQDEHLLLYHQTDPAEPGAARLVLPRVRREAELSAERGADAAEDK